MIDVGSKFKTLSSLMSKVYRDNDFTYDNLCIGGVDPPILQDNTPLI
jgi:hypothetical protein